MFDKDDISKEIAKDVIMLKKKEKKELKELINLSFHQKLIFLIFLSSFLTVLFYFSIFHIPVKEMTSLNVDNKFLIVEEQNNSTNTDPYLMEKAKNISDCLKIKNESIKDKCLLKFNTLAAFLNLSNKSLREEKIFNYAIEQKNESICAFLENIEKIKECENTILPPCLNSSDIDLCLAKYYDNKSKCIDDDCLFKFAMYKNNSSICDAINNSVLKASCTGLIIGRDTCYDLNNNTFEEDYCYQILATLSKNFGYCGNIKNDPYRYDCYVNYSITEHDPYQCEHVDLLKKWKCYSLYSNLTGDIRGCDAINEFAEGSKNKCYFDYAVKYGDPGVCSEITRFSIRESCYADVVLFKKEMLTEEKCNKIIDESWKDKCLEYAKENQ